MRELSYQVFIFSTAIALLTVAIATAYSVSSRGEAVFRFVALEQKALASYTKKIAVDIGPYQIQLMEKEGGK